MLRGLLRRVDMRVTLENRLDALVRLHTPWPPGKIGGAYQPRGGVNNLSRESFYGPNAGLTEVLVPAGFGTIFYHPGFLLSPGGHRHVPGPANIPTTISGPGLALSLVLPCRPRR